MSNEERDRAIRELQNSINVGLCPDIESRKVAIKALEQEPCDDAISRQAALDLCERFDGCVPYSVLSSYDMLPPVKPQESKTGYCKDCKYFEYDSWAKVNGIPLIVAHEICKRWGDGCKTSEDGYCFLFEPQESEGV